MAALGPGAGPEGTALELEMQDRVRAGARHGAWVALTELALAVRPRRRADFCPSVGCLLVSPCHSCFCFLSPLFINGFFFSLF